MHKVNFLPRAYIEESNNRIIKLLLFIFIILFIIVSVKIIYHKKQLNEVNKNIQNLKYTVHNSRKKEKVYIRKDNSIKEFNNFYEFVSPHINCEKLKVYNKNIIFEGTAYNIESYIQVLEALEKNNNYLIKDFKQLHKKEESVKFSMELEVIK